jgi:hypothetical protein
VNWIFINILKLTALRGKKGGVDKEVPESIPSTNLDDHIHGSLIRRFVAGKSVSKYLAAEWLCNLRRGDSLVGIVSCRVPVNESRTLSPSRFRHRPVLFSLIGDDEGEQELFGMELKGEEDLIRLNIRRSGREAESVRELEIWQKWPAKDHESVLEL